MFGSYPQDYLDEKEWSFSDKKQLMLKEKIENGHLSLKNIEGVKIYRGVTTGYNPAFIISNEQRNKLIAEDHNNSKIIKNMLQGRNIRKWYYNESEENLIFTRRGTDIEKFPFIKNIYMVFMIILSLKPPRIVQKDVNLETINGLKYWIIRHTTVSLKNLKKLSGD